jgi:hypothetical protein
MTNNQIDVAKTLFAMSISCYICKTMQFSDREMHGESIGEKTNSLAHLVTLLQAFEVSLTFMSISLLFLILYHDSYVE